MRRLVTFLMAALLAFSGIALGGGGEDVEKYRSCRYCGMDRDKFSHSRVLLRYDDGSEFAGCSLHCAAVDLAVNIDRGPKEFLVGDFNSKKLVDAEKAFWVAGGSKSGVMTARPKWAFEKKEDAEKFIRESGGTLVSFDEAVKAAYEDMYNDTKMIRERRKMKRMKAMEGKGPQ